MVNEPSRMDSHGCFCMMQSFWCWIMATMFTDKQNNLGDNTQQWSNDGHFVVIWWSTDAFVLNGLRLVVSWCLVMVVSEENEWENSQVYKGRWSQLQVLNMQRFIGEPPSPYLSLGTWHSHWWRGHQDCLVFQPSGAVPEPIYHCREQW